MAHIIKKGPIKVPTQPKDFDLQATGLVFKSYDNQIALEFNVMQQDGTPADLLGANLRLLMFIYDEVDGTIKKEPIPFITKNLVTESFLNGHVVYILPEAMKAYNGMVEAYVYIEYPDGSTSDNLGFTFRMKRSAIDGLAQDKADYFIEDFKQLLDGVKQEATDAVNEALAKVEVVSENVSSAQNDLTILEGRIDQANREIDKVLSGANEFRTDIDTLKNSKADKTFVDAQLAQTKSDLAQTATNKVDKNGVEQVSWGNLTQEVKENITGGNTAVVGKNSVSTANIVNNSVTMEKLGFATQGYFQNSITGRRVNIDTERKVIELTGTSDIRTNQRLVGVPAGEYSFDGITGVTLVYTIVSNVTFAERKLHFASNDSELPQNAILLGFLRPDIDLYQLNGFYYIDGSMVKPHLPQNGEIGELITNPNWVNVDTTNNQLIVTNVVRLKEKATTHIIPSGEYSFDGIGDSLVVVFNVKQNTIRFIPAATYKSDVNKRDVVFGLFRLDYGYYELNGGYSIDGNAVLQFTEKDKKDIENLLTNPSYSSNELVVITDVPAGAYDSSLPFIPINESDPYTVIYDVYDQLITDYPDYVTRSLLGYSDDAPIYRYDFTPPKPKNYNREYKFPKIYYQSAIHGHEKMAAMGGASFFKSLCDDWRTDDTLRMLRWNVQFIVVPMLNPSGFNLNQRKKENGVDLARNFPYNWRPNDDPDSLYYPGSEPASEVETQFVIELLENETDIVFAFDQHNSGELYRVGYSIWLGTGNESLLPLLSGIGQQMSTKTKIDYAYAPQGNESLFQLLYSSTPGSAASYIQSIGIPATLFELTPILKEGEVEDTQKFTVDAIGNAFQAVVKHYLT